MMVLGNCSQQAFFPVTGVSLRILKLADIDSDGDQDAISFDVAQECIYFF